VKFVNWINPLMPKREIARETVRKCSGRLEVKRKGLGAGERVTLCIWGRRKSILLEGSQAMLPRPSDKDRIRVKTLG
jgi:hypothetical protein